MSDLQTNQPDDKFFISENASFVVNERTGESFISQRAASRLLNCPETTLRDNIKARKITPFEFRILTQSGFQAGNKARLLSEESFAELAAKFNPILLAKMAKAGIRMFNYGQAGYKLNLEPPKIPFTPPSDHEMTVLAFEAKVRELKFEQNTKELPGLRKLVEHFQSPEIPQDENYYSIAQWAKIEGVSLTRPNYNKLIKRAAANFRDAYGGEVNPKLITQSNGKSIYHYQQKDFCFIENAYNSIMTQNEITNLRRGKNLERKRESLDRLIESMKSPFDDNEI